MKWFSQKRSIICFEELRKDYWNAWNGGLYMFHLSFPICWLSAYCFCSIPLYMLKLNAEQLWRRELLVLIRQKQLTSVETNGDMSWPSRDERCDHATKWLPLFRGCQWPRGGISGLRDQMRRMNSLRHSGSSLTSAASVKWRPGQVQQQDSNPSKEADAWPHLAN